jgi:hypothetical protein
MAWLSPRDVTADDADTKLAIRTTCLADPFIASHRAVDDQRCKRDRWPPQARAAVVWGRSENTPANILSPSVNIDHLAAIG